MDFFKAVFLPDDEEEETTRETDEGDNKEGDGPSEEAADEGEIEEEEGAEEEEQASGFSAWGLGSLLQTIATKSEEVLREYSAELQEFGEGLKKETEELVETTATTVNDLPSSLESGAQVAQTSLEGVGHTIEEFGSSLWKGTTEILASVKEAVALVEEEVAANAGGSRPRAPSAAAGLASAIPRGKYSRYEALVSAMQRDSSTYCDEPDDTDDFTKWLDSFDLKNREADIEAVLKDNAFMQELQSRIVPLIVEREAFWTRYFYRLHKLQQAEDARADLVKRATTSEEEDLSWDVDDDGDEAHSSPAALPAAASHDTDADGSAGDSASGAAADSTDAVGATSATESEKGATSVSGEAGDGDGVAAAAAVDGASAGSGDTRKGDPEGDKEGEATSPSESLQKPGNVLLTEVKVPRLEDAGIEECALPLADIQAAFEIAARERPREPSNRSSSSDSSAGSEWQVVTKDDASKEDGPKAPQPTATAAAITDPAAAADTDADAADATDTTTIAAGKESSAALAPASTASEPVTPGGEDTAELATEPDADSASEGSRGEGKEAGRKGGKVREEKGERAPKVGADGIEDEDWGEWE